MISFARGVPAAECLPIAELADCARAAVERDGAAVLSYGTGAGYSPLREWIGVHHGVEPERVLIANGSLQAFVFLAQRLLAGDRRRVLVEAPTYDRPLKLLRDLGAEVVGVPVDEDGLDVDELERELAHGAPPAFVYVIPTFQNPTGRTLSLERRRRLVALARDRDLTILEDDPYGLVRFEGERLPTLHDLDGGEGVIYASSFSKTVAPGLRVGYLVLPDRPFAEALRATANGTYISPSHLGEATVLEFLRRGMLESSLQRVCRLLRLRRDTMLAALERELPWTRWSRPDGGYFLWLDLASEIDARRLLARAEAAGVAFVPGSDFFADASGTASLRLAYSFVSPEEIVAGIAQLAALVPAPVTA